MKRSSLQRKTRLVAKKRDSLQRRTRMRQVSKRRKTRVGKLDIVRLVGEDMTELRRRVYERDRGMCQLLLSGCWIKTSWERGELAHVRTKRNNGDTEQNTVWACPNCHEKSHNCNGKPCPPKAVTA